MLYVIIPPPRLLGIFINISCNFIFFCTKRKTRFVYIFFNKSNSSSFSYTLLQDQFFSNQQCFFYNVYNCHHCSSHMYCKQHDNISMNDCSTKAMEKVHPKYPTIFNNLTTDNMKLQKPPFNAGLQKKLAKIW